MSSLSAGSTASEMVFVELMRALAKSEDRLAVLADFVHRYPDREAEIRELASFNSALHDAPTLPPPPPLPDQIGEFHIGRLIKIGGMGEIYEAYHQRLDRRVALKIIRRGWSTSFARERFAREQHVLANLHHSNIVPIQTGGEDGPFQYFTMPFIQGSALNHVVDAVASLSSSNSSSRTPSMPEIASRVLHQEVDRSPSASSPFQTPSQTAEDQSQLPPGIQLNLSPGYFVSVARTMADVANAIEYAHQAGILHRDLKPANVMIEPNGHCWVIDFGLAARLITSENQPTNNKTGETLFGSVTSELGGGTYNYMAPERWQGKAADERSDVFSLGAMLYELITLRPAYRGDVPSAQIKHKMLNGVRTPARQLVKNVPDDLVAITDKAMNLDPAHRYQSAAELADELRRWLRFEPICAKPAKPWKRIKLWARRKPAVAVAMLCATVAFVSTAAAVVDAYAHQAFTAQADSRLANSRLDQNRLYQALLGQRFIGWSDKAWSDIKKLTADGYSLDLKSLASETRLGVDAKMVKVLDYSSAYLAYSPSGNRLLMVEYAPPRLKGEPITSVERRAQLWDFTKHQLVQLSKSSHDSTGAVAYRHEDHPLQLVWNRSDADAVGVWDLQQDALNTRLPLPFSLQEPPAAWSFTPDGTYASAIVRKDEQGHLYVWETANGRQVAEFKTTASNLELSPDGKLVATACPKGVIEILSVVDGVVKSSFSESHTDILCFAWTKDRVRRLDGSEPGWLLAAGANGGDLTIWDVARRSARSRCVGSAFEIFKLAFSPDGMTLASMGRGNPFLWNVETGELLLRLGFANTMTTMVYSPTGDELAVGSSAAWGSPGLTQIYEIQESRGQQVLLGLRAPVSQVCISDKGGIVAALTDNWQLGVWDLKKHRLLHLFQVPIGQYAESAGLAIDTDERRVAVMAGTQAKVWDIESGEVLKSVDLPSGFLDSLAFQNANTLVAARQESVDSKFDPVGPNPRPDEAPRVCRVRNLLSAEPDKPLVTIADFKRTAVWNTLTPSGNRLLMEGYDEPGVTPTRRMIKLFEIPSGRELWEITSPYASPSHRIEAMDPMGRRIVMAGADMKFDSPLLIDLETKALVRQMKSSVKGLGPDAMLHAHAINTPELTEKAFLSVQNETDQELLRLGLVKSLAGCLVKLSRDNRYVVYGCVDGSVVVADLWSLEKQLAELGFH